MVIPEVVLDPSPDVGASVPVTSRSGSLAEFRVVCSARLRRRRCPRGNTRSSRTGKRSRRQPSGLVAGLLVHDGVTRSVDGSGSSTPCRRPCRGTRSSPGGGRGLVRGAAWSPGRRDRSTRRARGGDDVDLHPALGAAPTSWLLDHWSADVGIGVLLRGSRRVASPDRFLDLGQRSRRCHVRVADRGGPARCRDLRHARPVGRALAAENAIGVHAPRVTLSAGMTRLVFDRCLMRPPARRSI